MLFINYLHQIYNAMTKKDAIKVFEDKKIRAVWDDQKEEWYFSIVDVIEVLTDSERPRKYWGGFKKEVENRRKSVDRRNRTTEITLF